MWQKSTVIGGYVVYVRLFANLLNGSNLPAQIVHLTRIIPYSFELIITLFLRVCSVLLPFVQFYWLDTSLQSKKLVHFFCQLSIENKRIN